MWFRNVLTSSSVAATVFAGLSMTPSGLRAEPSPAQPATHRLEDKWLRYRCTFYALDRDFRVVSTKSYQTDARSEAEFLSLQGPTISAWGRELERAGVKWSVLRCVTTSVTPVNP